MKLTRSDVSVVLELAAATRTRTDSSTNCRRNGRFEGNTGITTYATRPDVLDSAHCDRDADRQVMVDARPERAIEIFKRPRSQENLTQGGY